MLITNEQFEAMSLRQKAFYPFTDEQWKALSRDQKNRVFFARKKFSVKKKVATPEADLVEVFKHQAAAVALNRIISES